MSKSFLGVRCGAAMTVNVMRDLVDQNIVKIKCANGIEAVMAEFEWMSAEEYAFTPVNAVAAERTRPRALLLASASEQEDGTKSSNVFGRHALESPLASLRLAGWIKSGARSGNATTRGNAG